MQIRPISALVTTAISLVAWIMLRPTGGLLIYMALSLSALFLVQGKNRARSAATFFRWTVPFVLPLLLIHGVVNANYPARTWIVDLIPWRPEGFRFGFGISLNLLLFSTIGAYWLTVSRDDVTDDLVRWRLPGWAVLFLSQGIAMAALLERRIESVYLAQRARGIPVGPGILARLRAFPSVLLPAVVSTLVEADSRVPALVSRGFGSTRLASPPDRRRTAADWVFIVLPLGQLSVAAIFDALQ